MLTHLIVYFYELVYAWLNSRDFAPNIVMWGGPGGCNFVMLIINK